MRSIHTKKCHQNNPKKKSPDLLANNADVLVLEDEPTSVPHRSAKKAKIKQHLSTFQESTKQQCHNCHRFFKNLDKNKKCQKKRLKVTAVSPTKHKKPLVHRVSDKETSSTNQTHTTPRTTDDTLEYSIRWPSTTRKTFLNVNYNQQLYRIKKKFTKNFKKEFRST